MHLLGHSCVWGQCSYMFYHVSFDITCSSGLCCVCAFMACYTPHPKDQVHGVLWWWGQSAWFLELAVWLLGLGHLFTPIGVILLCLGRLISLSSISIISYHSRSKWSGEVTALSCQFQTQARVAWKPWRPVTHQIGTWGRGVQFGNGSLLQLLYLETKSFIAFIIDFWHGPCGTVFHLCSILHRW